MQTEINMQEETGEEKKNWLTKRTVVAILLILIVIPATIYLGWRFADRQYYITSLLIIFYTMIPFFLVFEKRKPQARELVVIAVLCVIAVASRAAFIWAPHFKPITAIIIIAGMAFGAEAGFLTGRCIGLRIQFYIRTGAVDAVADVRFWHSGFFGRAAPPQRVTQKETAAAVHLRRAHGYAHRGASLGYLRAVYYEHR